MSRLKTRLQVDLPVIPAAIAIYGVIYASSILLLLAWFGIMFTGRYPQKMFELNVQAFRWYQNLTAYRYLLRDEYPPFSGDPGAYPLKLEIDPPGKMSRLTTFFRLILAIPHLIIVYVLEIVAEVITVIAWFAILFTGGYPKGMFDFVIGCRRWIARVGGYLYLFTDRYPPFSLE